MLQALTLMQPPLQRFYDSLTDEQKARLNAINSEPQPVRTGRGTLPPDLSQVCSGQATRAANVPTDRIVQTLKPTDSQRSALDALNEAATRAADFLKANCMEDPTLTPPGRVAAMEQRPCVDPTPINSAPASWRLQPDLTLTAGLNGRASGLCRCGARIAMRRAPKIWRRKPLRPQQDCRRRRRSFRTAL
jgi:hypothetical protein